MIIGLRKSGAETPVCLRKAKCKYDQSQTGDKEMLSIQNNTKNLNTASTILHHKQQLWCDVSYKLWTNHEYMLRTIEFRVVVWTPSCHWPRPSLMCCVQYFVCGFFEVHSCRPHHRAQTAEKRRWWRVVNLMLWTVFLINLMLPVSIAWTCSSSLIGDDR